MHSTRSRESLVIAVGNFLKNRLQLKFLNLRILFDRWGNFSAGAPVSPGDTCHFIDDTKCLADRACHFIDGTKRLVGRNCHFIDDMKAACKSSDDPINC